MPHYKLCDYCGQEFKPKNYRHRFCSHDCAYPLRDCVLCGKAYRSKLHNQTYCSNKCAGISKRRRVEKTCSYCGKIFDQVKSHADRHLTPHCSHECYSKTLEVERLTAECGNCGLELERVPSRISNQVFCSSECRNEKWQGEDNPSWKADNVVRGRGDNWDRQRRKVHKRDNMTCQVCGYHHGMKKKRRYIDVHHIIPYREFSGDWKQANELSNLITLCRQCHVKVEHGKLPCPRRLL